MRQISGQLSGQDGTVYNVSPGFPAFFLSCAFVSLSFQCKASVVPGDCLKNGSKGYIMPVLVLALSLSSWYIRQVRVVVLDELAKGMWQEKEPEECRNGRFCSGMC